MSRLDIFRGLGMATTLIGYAILANYTNQSEKMGMLGALVALAPIVLTGVVLAWRSAHRRFMLSWVTFLLMTLLWLLWPVLKQHYGWVYWLEHESMQWALFIVFARTLFAHRQPLCTQFAAIVHGPLTPEHARYARQITIAWTAFFATMILISTGLFFTQPIAIWSVFANFIFLPLVALMFIVEYGVRKWALPDLDETSIMDGVRAFMQHSARRY
uniref:Transmembrane protein n=1 Tax=mine drainage metagenome TaxID=410659 RepID=E6QWF5_9ZZZZ